MLDSPRREAEALKKLLLFLLECSIPRALLDFLTCSHLLSSLLIGLTFLQDPPQPLAHIPEFEMSTSVGVRIFLPCIVVEVYTLVVDQIFAATGIGRGSIGNLGCRCSFLPIIIIVLVFIHHIVGVLVIHLHDDKNGR